MLSFLAMGIADSLRQVRERIRLAAVQAGRDIDSIKLIAVTKTVEPARILEAVNAGIFFLGENRVQEAQKKIQDVRFKSNRLSAKTRIGIPETGVEWHLIGNLQKNKARTAVQLFDLIHSLDSTSLAVELNRRSEQIGKIQRVLVQVKLSDEATKYGIPEKGLMELLEKVAVMKNLKLEGLMTMPPFFNRPEKARPLFRLLRELADSCVRQGFPLKDLSMGMSNDYGIAIQEGATMVRIGTAIFGERNYGASRSS